MINYLKKAIPKWIYWIGLFTVLSGFLTTIAIKFQEIKENRGFNEVLFGLLLAEMEPVDSFKYEVYYRKEEVEVKLRKARWSGDVYIFVEDGKKWIYAGYWNNTEKKFNYTDFGGKYRLIQKK